MTRSYETEERIAIKMDSGISYIDAVRQTAAERKGLRDECETIRNK
jgi:hypothetical protein